jgi:hypothetical protein
MRVCSQRHAPAALPQERPGTHCTGGRVGPRTGLDRCGKYCLHRDSIPGPSSPALGPTQPPVQVQEVEWASGSGWKGAENIVSAGLFDLRSVPGPSLNMWAMKITRTNNETVIRTDPNECSIWFVAAMLQFPPFLLMTT